MEEEYGSGALGKVAAYVDDTINTVGEWADSWLPSTWFGRGSTSVEMAERTPLTERIGTMPEQRLLSSSGWSSSRVIEPPAPSVPVVDPLEGPEGGFAGEPSFAESLTDQQFRELPELPEMRSVRLDLGEIEMQERQAVIDDINRDLDRYEDSWSSLTDEDLSLEDSELEDLLPPDRPELGTDAWRADMEQREVNLINAGFETDWSTFEWSDNIPTRIAQRLQMFNEQQLWYNAGRGIGVDGLSGELAAVDELAEVGELGGGALAALGLVPGVGEIYIGVGIAIAAGSLGWKLVEQQDRAHEKYLKDHHLDVHTTDSKPDDFPGYGTVAYVLVTDTVSIPCTITDVDANNPNKWYVTMTDMTNFKRTDVAVNKANVVLSYGKKKTWDMTDAEKNGFRPLVSKDGKVYYLPRYPLYPVGTRVKSKKTNHIGTIEYAYYKNGIHDMAEFHTNDDKYGVRFDSKKRRKGPINWMSVTEFLVKSPFTDQFKSIYGRIQALQQKVKAPMRNSGDLGYKVGDRVIYEGQHGVLVQKLGTNFFNVRIDGELADKAAKASLFTREPKGYVPQVADSFAPGDRIVYHGRHGVLKQNMGGDYFVMRLDGAGADTASNTKHFIKESPDYGKTRVYAGFKVGDRVVYDGHHAVIVGKSSPDTFNVRFDGTLTEQSVNARDLSREDADYVASPFAQTDYPPDPEPKVEPITEWQSIDPIPTAPHVRRSLANLTDKEWWTARRFFYTIDGKKTCLYRPNAKTIIRNEFKTDLFAIPMFDDKVCCNIAQPCWEMLNIFIEEVAESAKLLERGVDLDDRLIGRTEDPRTPWNIGGEASERINPSQDYATSRWQWASKLFDDVKEADYKRFRDVLMEIASSRNAYAWKSFQQVTLGEVTERYQQLSAVVSFLKDQGDYSQLHSVKRIEAEVDLCRYILEEKFDIAVQRTPVTQFAVNRDIRGYRPDFVFDGTEMYMELYNELPIPTNANFRGHATIVEFLETQWKPAFDAWNAESANPVDPGAFLRGRYAWTEQGWSLPIDDRKYFLMTPTISYREGNEMLMGGKRPERDYELFLEAYHEVFVERSDFYHPRTGKYDIILSGQQLRTPLTAVRVPAMTPVELHFVSPETVPTPAVPEEDSTSSLILFGLGVILVSVIISNYGSSG